MPASLDPTGGMPAAGQSTLVHHVLPLLIVVLAAIAVAVLSPVEVRLRARARNDTVLRPRIDVELLWGLVHLRPRVQVPRHPLRHLVLRISGGGRSGRTASGSGSNVARHATRGLQHAASGTAAGRYLFGMTAAVAVRRLQVSVAFQTGDPARTAIVAGAAWGVLGALVTWLETYLRFERPPELEVQPLFSGPARFRASLDCILAARLGHVMVAALRSYLRGAGATGRGDAA
jgi:hypothetical protein